MPLDVSSVASNVRYFKTKATQFENHVYKFEISRYHRF